VRADDLESSPVLLGCDFLAHQVDHDHFGVNSFKVSPWQLEDHSALADSDDLGAPFDQTVIKQVLTLELAQFLLAFGVLLLQPLVEEEVDDKQFIIHAAGGDSEEEELVVEDKRGTLLADCVAVDAQLLVLVLHTKNEIVLGCLYRIGQYSLDRTAFLRYFGVTHFIKPLIHVEG